MKNSIKTLLIVLSMALTTNLMAQKKPFYNTEEEVVEAAYKQLDFSMKEGALKEWAEDFKPKGSYTMDIAIIHKGTVVTIRPVERSEDGDIRTQNALKNYMKNYRFPFKMSKTKSTQITYEFKF